MERNPSTVVPALFAELPRLHTSLGPVLVASPEQIATHPDWESAYSHQRKDRRFYQIAQETVLPCFEHGYFLLPRAGVEQRLMFQPFFVLDQDLVAGAGHRTQEILKSIRRAWPGFLTMRTLMVGCIAGEGHLDDGTEHQHAAAAAALREAVEQYSRQIGARLIVFKEFPGTYRSSMSCLSNDGYARIPSMPMVRLKIEAGSFEQFMSRTLSKATRKDLRRKFRAADKAAPIQLQVTQGISDYVDEIYPLYLQVYDRSRLRFEKLTAEFLRRLSREMPDKARFFIWRHNGKAIAFSLCMVHGDAVYDEYLGMDYSVALDLHLYFYTLRDILDWAMGGGYKWYYSSALNYDPKCRLGCELVPLDLYVRHTSPILNPVLRRALRLLEPTRRDKALQGFANYSSLWGDA